MEDVPAAAGDATSPALRYLAGAERAAAALPGPPGRVRAQLVSRAGIIGVGSAARALAMACADAGLPAVLIGADPVALDRALAGIRAAYESELSRTQITADQRAGRLTLIHGSTALADVNDVDLIVEAGPQDLPRRLEIFRTLRALRCTDAVLASIAPTPNLHEIASLCGEPERLIGLNAFGAAHRSPVLEIVRSEQTSTEALAVALGFSARIRKIGVVLGPSQGSWGSRAMLDVLLSEAGELLHAGLSREHIDRVLESFGFAAGPFSLAERHAEVSAEHAEDGARRPASAARRSHGDAHASEGRMRHIPDAQLLACCLYPLINAGARMLAEGAAWRAGDIDVVWTRGYGFPTGRGGPMYHADQIGLATVYEGLRRLGSGRGPNWDPAPLIEELVHTGGRLTGWTHRPGPDSRGRPQASY